MKFEIEVRPHHLKDSPLREGLPQEAIVIRVDGQLLCTIVPVARHGPGIQITTTMLDLDEPQRLTIMGRENVVFAVPGEVRALQAEIARGLDS